MAREGRDWIGDRGFAVNLIFFKYDSYIVLRFYASSVVKHWGCWAGLFNGVFWYQVVVIDCLILSVTEPLVLFVYNLYQSISVWCLYHNTLTLLDCNLFCEFFLKASKCKFIQGFNILGHVDAVSLLIFLAPAGILNSVLERGNMSLGCKLFFLQASWKLRWSKIKV